MLVNYLFIIFVIIKISMATTPNPCQWIKVPNTHTWGGVNVSATSVTDCQNQCIASSTTNNCQYGLDWDPSNILNLTCWFSKTNLTSAASTVDHYYFNCSSIAFQVSTTFQPITASLPAPSSPCVWNIYNDTYTKGGIPIYLPNDTLENCQSWCYNNMLTCYNGFDYDPSKPVGQKCYQSVSNFLLSIIGVNHYNMSAACYGTGQTTTTPIILNGTACLLSLKILSAVLLFVSLVLRDIFTY